MKLPFYPWYDKLTWVYWVVWGWFALFLIGNILYVGLFVQNNSSTYTWFRNPGAPGTMLSSKRGTFEDISIRLSIIGNLVTLAVVCSWIMYRQNFGCNILWILLFGVMIFMTLLGNMGMGRFYNECNGQLQYGNICNDQNWCCVNEIFGNPLNGCPNTVPCAIPKSLNDLHPNQDFMGLFWLNFIMLVFQCAFLVFTIIFWTKSEGGTTKQEDDNQLNTEVTPPPKEEEEQVLIEPVPEVSEYRSTKSNIGQELVNRRVFSQKKSHGLKNNKN